MPLYCPFFFLSRLFCYFYRSTPLDRPPWLPVSQPQPNDSDPTLPRKLRHPLWKINMGSFPGRLSGSITSRCSIARSSQNVVSPPPMRSSTSLSRTVASIRFAHPLCLEWPRSCGSSTPICLSRSAPPSSSKVTGSSLVPRPSTGSTP